MWSNEIANGFTNTKGDTLLSLKEFTVFGGAEAVELIHKSEQYPRIITVITIKDNRRYTFFCAIKHPQFERYGILFKKSLTSFISFEDLSIVTVNNVSEIIYQEDYSIYVEDRFAYNNCRTIF